jgi:hypothetical protein
MTKLLMLLLTAAVAAGDDTLPSIPEIIEAEGQFAFTDGSSTYQFYSDGSFVLEPTGLCGRAIEGTWEWTGDGLMEITGTWTWINGISPLDDVRRMTLHLYLRSGETTESALLWRASDQRLYDVYCTVEELVKVPDAE